MNPEPICLMVNGELKKYVYLEEVKQELLERGWTVDGEEPEEAPRRGRPKKVEVEE